MTTIMTFDEFIDDYAKKKGIETWDAYLEVSKYDYKAYIQERASQLKVEVCEDCGKIKDEKGASVRWYYCGELPCGKGTWCQQNQYHLCYHCFTLKQRGGF